MKLEYIIKGLECKVYGDIQSEINHIVFDSRKIQKNDLFIPLRGTQTDGHQFINNAVELGATAIICEEVSPEIRDKITCIQVNDTSSALGIASSNYYGNPSSQLKLVGVTGTNGKTSIATLSHRTFSKYGYKCGLLSTVRNLVVEKELPSTHTTPDALAIQSLLKDMVDAGCTHAFMEVSSHAIDQNRISGLAFDLAIFTNLTHDHLDYHKTLDAYLKAKKKFFDELPSNAIALVNTDDKHGKVMIQNTLAKKKTFGVHSMADFKAKIIESHFEGMLVNIDGVEVWTKLIGNFNASNLLAVYATACLLDIPKEDVLRILSTLETVDGRFEYVKSVDGVTAIIDYAHTPDALKNVLDTINQIRDRKYQLITVVGAGGNRDKTKRPVMGKIASENSSKVIFTSDNPRNEDPRQIINEILAGVDKKVSDRVLAIEDRREAIKTASMLAQKGDIILIAGKGHETYQEIKGVKNYFNDKKVISEIFMVTNNN